MERRQGRKILPFLLGAEQQPQRHLDKLGHRAPLALYLRSRLEARPGRLVRQTQGERGKEFDAGNRLEGKTFFLSWGSRALPCLDVTP